MKYNSKEDVMLHVQTTVRKRRVKLNPDSEAVDRTVTGLLARYQKSGQLFYPCRFGEDKANICPCDHLDKEIEEKGVCHCQLFVVDAPSG